MSPCRGKKSDTGEVKDLGGELHNSTCEIYRMILKHFSILISHKHCQVLLTSDAVRLKHIINLTAPKACQCFEILLTQC